MAETTMVRPSREVIVIGAGEVFRRCYVVGNSCLPADRRVRFAHVVDVAPQNQLRSILSPELVGGEFRSWQLSHDFESSLRGLISQPELRNLPVLIATPTQYHVPYAVVILEEGHFIGIEKPIAASFDDLGTFEKLLMKHGTERIFLFAYYLLEKGLPLVVWTRRGHVDRFVANLVTFESSFPNWQEAHDALGEVLKIYGVILEGIGPAGCLDQRPWTLDPINGGNTVETFYHLMCLVDVIFGSECPISIQDVRLARHTETIRMLVRKGINVEDIAETLTWAKLQSGTGAQIELIAAKYVPPRLHQRWVIIACERGLLKMDLEAQRLEIRANSHFLSSTLRWPQRYATQFMLLTEKMDRPSLPIEDDILRRALVQTLHIREAGVLSGIASYQGEDIKPMYLSRELASNLVRTP